MMRLLAIFIAASCSLTEATTPLDSLARRLPVSFAAVDSTAITFTLTMPSRLEAGPYLHADLVVENTGELRGYQVPVDLLPCHGSVRFNWIRSDGPTQSQGCPLARASDLRTLVLKPRSFYGQRVELATVERPPCVRISDPRGCDWPPGHYVFWATLVIPGDPANRADNDASPRFATGTYTTPSVTVEVTKP